MLKYETMDFNEILIQKISGKIVGNIIEEKLEINYNKSNLKKNIYNKNLLKGKFRMLNHTRYRQSLSRKFDGQINESQNQSQLKQTLVINEIIKCGKDILGNIDMQEENQDQLVKQERFDNKFQQKSFLKKHINDHDFEQQNTLIQQNTGFEDYSAGQLSFTLSNDQKSRYSKQDSQIKKHSKSIKTQQQKNPHITWKNKLIDSNHPKDMKQYQTYINKFIQNHFQQANPQIGKWTKTSNSTKNLASSNQRNSSKEASSEKIMIESPIKIKDSSFKKTFELNKSKVKYFTDQTKRRKSIFIEKSTDKSYPNFNLSNYLSHHPQKSYDHFQNQNRAYLHTPEKNIMRKNHVPLSQQITKNIYGRLKYQVHDNSFIKDFKVQDKISQQKSDEIWRNFIDRSDQWIEKKKIHMIQRQAKQMLNPNFSQSKFKDESSHKKKAQLYENPKAESKNIKNTFVMKFEEKKFQPEFTFKNKNQQSNKKEQKKRQSSVQNCINKLKTQTQLLKVKLLSPIKNQMNDNEILNHYKESNESQSRKLVKKYSSTKDSYKKIVDEKYEYRQIKNFYGDCIGNQK